MTPLLVVMLAVGAWGSETLDGLEFHFGDPHVHTGASGDGGSADVGDCTGSCGAVADLARLAQDEGLDWVAITDHVNGGESAWARDFRVVLGEVLEAGRGSGLVTVPGAELWFKEAGRGELGHRNLYLFGTDADMVGLRIEDVRFAQTSMLMEDCRGIYRWLAEVDAALDQPVLLIPHHPAAKRPMPMDWDCYDPDWEPAVEVYSEHGSSMGDDQDYDPMWSGAEPTGTVHWALEYHQHRLGFMGGTDRHDTHPGAVCDLDTEHLSHPYGGGLTAVVLEEGETLDRRAIHDAITQHRTYATSGPMLPVSVRYSSAGARIGRLGDDLAMPAHQPLQVDVAVAPEHTGAVAEVTAVTAAGERVLDSLADGTWSTTFAVVPTWVYVRVEVDGTNWYTQACEDGGEDEREMLWMSPSWWTEGEGDLDGDGQSWAQGDCHDGDPEVFLGAFERCGQGGDADCDGLLDHEDPDCTGLSGPAPGPQVQPGLIWDAWEENEVPHGSGAGDLTEPARPQGCTTSPVSPGWLALVPLLGLRRRRT